MPEPRTVVRDPLTGPAVWYGPDLEPTDYMYQLDRSEVDEICRVRDDLISSDVGLGAVGRESVPMPALAETMTDWVQRLERGLGFVVVRGLDIDGWS